MRVTDPQLQLVGGASSREGRVQIVSGDGVAGTVCVRQRYWRAQAAMVVCKHLGYATGTAAR